VGRGRWRSGRPDGWGLDAAAAPDTAVVDIGEALDGVFAVSERLDDDRLDALPADRLAVAIDSLIETLRVIEEVTLPGAGYGGWVAPTGDAPHDSWRDFLVAVPDRDDERLRGWRERLRTVPIAQGVFDGLSTHATVASARTNDSCAASCTSRSTECSTRPLPAMIVTSPPPPRAPSVTFSPAGRGRARRLHPDELRSAT